MDGGNHKQESVLQEAERLINGDRRGTYGHALDDYSRTVGMFNALMAHKLKEPLTAEDGVMFMVCVKLSREAHHHQRDNLTDGCGYIGLLEHIEQERNKRSG